MTDRESGGLRGLVAACQTEQLDRGFVTGESFRSDGKWTEQWHRSQDGREIRRGAPVRRRRDLLEEERSGPRVQTFPYTYGSSGRLDRIDVRSPGGASRVHESYVYNDDHTSVVTL